MISAPPSSAGEDGECPFCNAKIRIPDGDTDDAETSVPSSHGATGGDFILFTCGECGQEIECASSMGGLTASCPTCGSQVNIPMSSTVEASAGDSAETSGEGSSSSSMTMRIDLMDLE
jgi:DNA-directed RNA polymerase subunit RPC12/RpoP